MTVDGTPASSIAAVDANARNLYRRARASGPDFGEIATVVRSLHTVLKHLRVEAEDPDSLLNSNQRESSVYARQLTPIVEDCDFTLKQLDTILEKYGLVDSSGDDAERGQANATGNGHARAIKGMEDRERDMVALIRTKLANQKTNIDIFLDTVQLHNPSRAPRPLDLENTDDRQLNSIKDKVDAIASRLFRRRGSGANSENEEDMWQQFCSELVAEGFSSEVLRKNKEVLRAYIRELDSNGLLDNGSPPSVRGLLDQRPHAPYPPYPMDSSAPPPVAITPASYPSHGDDMSPKEMVGPNLENEKFMPSLKYERRQPEQSPHQHNPYAPYPSQQLQGYQAPPPPVPHMSNQSTGLSYEPYSSESDSDSSSNQQWALISTRDLMALDRRQADHLAAQMNGLHLQPALMPPNYNASPGTSPNNRYLPAPQPLHPIQIPQAAPYPPDHQLSSSPQTQALMGLSPRYVPPLPPYMSSPTSSQMGMTPPPAYGTSPTPASAMPQRYSKLAPDSHGQEIPLEAKWTKISRRLVSLEVLDKAGFRYEARPEFVAVLGTLSREEIQELARQSAAVRSSRGGLSGAARAPNPPYPDEKHRSNGKRAVSDSDSDSDSLCDESDTSDDDDSQGYNKERYKPRHHRGDEKEGKDEKGTKVYPFIVPPPSSNNESKASPASTVQPKPILKNKNENRVRFDKDGPREISPGEASGERHHRSSRDDRDRDGHRRRDGDRHRRRDRGDRDRSRERDRDHRDRHRDPDREHRRHRSDRGERARGDRYRDRDRDRERERDRERDERERDYPQDRRDDKRTKKRVWGETLGAVGIGGAAASLLSVLTEAATGL